MSWSFQLFKLKGGLVVIFVDIAGISNNPWSKIVTCFVGVKIRRVQLCRSYKIETSFP